MVTMIKPFNTYSPPTERSVCENPVNSVEALPVKAAGNTEPSLARKGLEGVTTQALRLRLLKLRLQARANNCAHERGTPFVGEGDEIVCSCGTTARSQDKEPDDNTKEVCLPHHQHGCRKPGPLGHRPVTDGSKAGELLEHPKAVDTTAGAERPAANVMKSATDVPMDNQQPSSGGNPAEGSEISKSELTTRTRHASPVLTEEQRTEICRLYTTRRISLNQLVRQFHAGYPRIREVLLRAGITIRTVADNLRHYNGSEEGRRHQLEICKRNAFRAGYKPTERQLASGRTNLIAYNKSEEHRSVAQEVGKTYGAANCKAWAQSEEGREHARREGRRTAEEFDARSAPCIRAGLRARTSRQQKALYELLNLVLGQDVILEYHPVNTRYFIDIAIVSKNIAIEVDDRNHEMYPEQRRLDAIRREDLEKLGWRFIRFTNVQIDDHCQECFREILSFANVELSFGVLTATSARPRLPITDRVKI